MNIKMLRTFGNVDDDLVERAAQKSKSVDEITFVACSAIKHRKKRLTFRKLMIAAVLVVFTGVTAFAYGSDIIERMRITFGNHTAIQVDVISDDLRVSLQYTTEGMSEEYLMIINGVTEFYKIEEARNLVPFNFKEPQNLPEDLGFARGSVPYSKDGLHGHRVWLFYVDNHYDFDPTGDMYAFSANIGRSLMILQQRLGNDAFLNVLTVGEIEMIIIGETEVLGISENGGLAQLVFIWDGTLYELSGYQLDSEELLAIAEFLIR
jgi:hypothetical protein